MTPSRESQVLAPCLTCGGDRLLIGETPVCAACVVKAANDVMREFEGQPSPGLRMCTCCPIHGPHPRETS